MLFSLSLSLGMAGSVHGGCEERFPLGMGGGVLFWRVRGAIGITDESFGQRVDEMSYWFDTNS